MIYPFTTTLIQALAPELGARVELEPEFGYVGEIFFANGRRSLIKNTTFDLNPHGASRVVKDKAYTNYLLTKHGFRVPPTQSFFADGFLAHLGENQNRDRQAALTYARTLGYPVIAKPNDLSQGMLVFKAHDESELATAIDRIFERVRVLLIQKFCVGRDYRVVVLGDRVRMAYERRSLSITGDGRSTIEELIGQKQAEFLASGRTNVKISRNDSALQLRLERLNYSLQTVLDWGQVLPLMDNTNLSTGGEGIDLTHDIHPDYGQLAVEVSQCMGLQLSGVDLICPDLTQPLTEDYSIIEVNGAPGLDNYASLGPAALERVKALYRDVLLALEVSSPPCHHARHTQALGQGA